MYTLDNTVAEELDNLSHKIHENNIDWWFNFKGKPKRRNVGELLCLIHSEISEAMGGHRKNLMDDKLPHRKMLEVELADAVIRILDLGKGLNLNVGSALVEKVNYNLHREDHKIENRRKKHGKKY